MRHDEVAGPSRKPVSSSSRKEFDDSLSSLSIESEDDTNLMNQVIAAGVNKIVKTEGSIPINIPAKPRPSAELCNDSISSVDSCGKDDASNSILEQCIQMGINKVVKKESSKSRDRIVTSSPKRSMLPKLSSKPGISKVDKEQERRDEELLQECIATGILRNTRTGHQPLVQTFAQMSISEPKNAESTSVIATDNQRASTITGVEAKAEEINKSKSQPMPSSIDFSFKCSENRDRDENTASRNELSRQASWTMLNGSSTGFDLNLSLGSVDDNILERSNEYPATKLSMGAFADFDDDSIMEMSNEFMVDNERLTEAKIEDKHKDPDLMMKSVDRLTQDFVSTAEYLRKNTANISDEISFEHKMSGSNNNTWTDENSFPSISLSAPMIGSTNEEATIATDHIYPMPEERDPPNIHDDKTPTNEQYTFTTNRDEADGISPKIEFKVGGELNTQSLNKVNLLSFGPMSIETCSTMSNSTIVQVEAKRIAHKLTSMTNRLMDSTTSLDLENVRPPSSMDCISLNSYNDSSIHQSPLKQPKKSLMSGYVAKRALGHPIISASAESVNSIFNIDSIRPPSIMDELLDSMISVDSIVSEVVDPTMMGISNYETALSDMEDSLTLRSCQDLSKDETYAGTSSDFSSVESTPKKKRNSRSLTPKQKRQSDKDRYKTYTIQVDMLLKAQQEQKQDHSGTESMRRSLNARQRRNEDRQRFETQVISHSPARTAEGRKQEPDRHRTFNIDANEVDDDLSIQAMTQNFEFLRNGTATVNGTNFDTSGIRNKLNRIKSGGASSSLSRQTDDSLEYERQTSETESQRDQKNSLIYDANLSLEQDESPASTPSQPEQQKVKSPKSSYISPYRMTTRINPMKNKAVKVTKGPTIAKIVNRNPGLDLKSYSGPANKANVAKNQSNGVKSAPPKTSIIPKPSTTPTQSEEPPSMPIRQGTFIQDEPTLDNVPVVIDASPKRTTLSKLKPPTRVPSSSKVPTTPTTPTEKNTSSKKASNFPASITQLKYRSNSNTSMKSPIVAPVRSNTGINLNNPKKIVASKIASIWKSGEKRESLLKKPLSTSSGQLSSGGKLSIPGSRKLVGSAGKDRIKRSSTCNEIGEWNKLEDSIYILI